MWGLGLLSGEQGCGNGVQFEWLFRHAFRRGGCVRGTHIPARSCVLLEGVAREVGRYRVAVPSSLGESPALGAPFGLPPRLRVCYGLSAAIGGTGSRRGIRRATRVQLGIHQLASPSSRIRAGTRSARMTVASRMIPAARPIASGLTS